MTTTYEQAMNGVTFPNANFDDAPAGNSWGAEFLKKCKKASAHPGSEMNRVNEIFHGFLKGKGWRWDPGGAGASYVAGARLLDGSRTSGECAYPAYALAFLIDAPYPYGFYKFKPKNKNDKKKPKNDASVETYRGLHNRGFISNHANALDGPQPNITQSNGNMLQGYYFWGNHKVVKYKNKFYDPNYKAIYTSLAGMAVASLQSVRDNVRLRDMRDYNPLSPWGLLLGWGLPRLTVLKLSDVLFGTTHRINVVKAVNVQDQNVAGYYIEWEEGWRRPDYGGRGTIYGPLAQNPLVR